MNIIDNIMNIIDFIHEISQFMNIIDNIHEYYLFYS
jgi:hypothetical protein